MASEIYCMAGMTYREECERNCQSIIRRELAVGAFIDEVQERMGGRYLSFIVGHSVAVNVALKFRNKYPWRVNVDV